ncbi:hypothetical protein ADICEAN_00418 [Cesiribacter andamanensis AMV16]|uniref:Uncharacterized protein n=1 Tax=Cesiribacter andamanensis AMV16 TaxID=1279009 RepID=M7P1A4_9BACT|nr:hypothetical protein ADICEAN_00418 [Cesiribacter andamanensis AMV16]
MVGEPNEQAGQGQQGNDPGLGLPVVGDPLQQQQEKGRGRAYRNANEAGYGKPFKGKQQGGQLLYRTEVRAKFFHGYRALSRRMPGIACPARAGSRRHHPELYPGGSRQTPLPMAAKVVICPHNGKHSPPEGAYPYKADPHAPGKWSDGGGCCLCTGDEE